jgi:hypothetical protein
MEQRHDLSLCTFSQVELAVCVQMCLALGRYFDP